MKKSHVFSLFLTAVAATAALTGHASAVVVSFAPGDLGGWTQVAVPGGTIGGGYAFQATNATFGSRMNWQNPTGNVGGVTVTTTANADGRGVQHDTAILRSPTFTLNGSNGASTYGTVTDISFSLLGGMGTATGPSSVTVLPPVSVNQPSGQYIGFLGVALRRVGDDSYLLWGTRTSNAQSNNWQTVTWDATALAAATASDPVGTLYTLDFIDAAYGDWGWVSMDQVTLNTVPEAGAWIMGLGGAAGMLLRRRRRAA